MTEIQRNPSKELAREEYTRPGRTFVPNVDICETPGALLLWADLPGVDDKSVEVHLADGVLSIEGRVSPADYENLTPAYTEYNVGNFVRRFTLSRDIDSDRIRARMLNGVLELELPKASHTLPRKIEIRS
jgi:HSP20 family molecular chaperone IbpA